MKSIYLDHAATSPMHPDVIQAMIPVMEGTFGNPSSVHAFGREARHIVDVARDKVAASIGASDKQIIFTSGGTEADNMALIGTAIARKEQGKHIITTAIEHHATLHAANYLESQGFDVTYLPVDTTGAVKLEDLQAALRPDTILVSVMMINNETGIIQPVQAIGELLKSHAAYFHTDAVQAYGTEEIDVVSLGVDLLSVSAHKINGPKGIGALYVADHVRIKPITYGGEQERKRRAGTENVASIAGFGKACELAMHQRAERKAVYQDLQDTFVSELEAAGTNFFINGDTDHRSAGIVNLSFPGTNVESLLMNFDLSGVTVSSGSACTAGSVDPSHVLKAMYGEDERVTNSIRFSFGYGNTAEAVAEAAQTVAAIIKRLTKGKE
ncbi:cysteine desulfurase family protein [Terribacillus sp. DMT04]|uniref:cysteine desulfurase family protein n=1 Tax=Terribacillus sp. DMT04 TaxID=2850441 RepID=UPI001C2BE45B|nr:cysteine desulfurase family protein [Terribacillus sp. DMT04]QXE00518.1 cysteine desulfurase [Terribacillus sp. DMT04]